MCKKNCMFVKINRLFVKINRPFMKTNRLFVKRNVGEIFRSRYVRIAIFVTQFSTG